MTRVPTFWSAIVLFVVSFSTGDHLESTLLERIAQISKPGSHDQLKLYKYPHSDRANMEARREYWRLVRAR